MKIRDINQELTGLAKLRWECVRLNPKYEKAFEGFFNELKAALFKGGDKGLRSPKLDTKTLKYLLSLIFLKSYPMSDGQTIKELKTDIKFSKKHSDILIALGFYGAIVFQLPSVKEMQRSIKGEWGISPPVPPDLEHPNPWSLESLIDDIANPVKCLGNHSLEFSHELKPGEINQLDELFQKTTKESLIDFKDKELHNNPQDVFMPLFGARIVTKITPKFIEDVTYPTGKIILEINLDEDIKYIKHQLNQLISQEIAELSSRGWKQDKRNHIVANLRQLRIYKDIMQGKSFTKVAAETHGAKYLRSPKRAKDAVYDDFKAGFKLVNGRKYTPFEDLKRIKETAPPLRTCGTCKTDYPDKYNLCIKSGRFNKETGEYDWVPLCPESARYVGKDYKGQREGLKEVATLEELDILYKTGKRKYKRGQQKNKLQY